MPKLTIVKSCLAAVVLVATLENAARAQFAPIHLDPSSYSQDMVVERPLPATTASMDNGKVNTGASFYEMGYDGNSPSTGLPSAGSTIVTGAASDHSYTFAPDYTTNNAVMIDPTVTNATVTLTSPDFYSALSFLVAAGNGAETVTYKVHHLNGTVDTGSIVCPDWFNNTPVAYTANGRCDVQGRTFDSVSSGNPRLYSKDITLGNTGSPVTSIDFGRTGSGGHGAIFAISGSTGSGFNPITFTGYNQDMIVEAAAQILPPSSLYTTASMDNGMGNTANSWYAKGFDLAATNTGLPAAGSTIASAAALDHQYTFAPSYSSNNVAYVDSSTTGTMIWATPTKHSALSFLTSAGHGPVIVDYTVNYQDTTTESGTFSVADWTTSGTPIAFAANGRVDVVSGLYSYVNQNNPRLYTVDIALGNTVTPVTSVSLAFDPANTNASSVVAFFAVSGTGGTIAPVIAASPLSFNTNIASTVQISVAVSGSLPLTYHWQKGLGNSYTNLTDGGRISGSGTTNLTIGSVTFSDDANYQLVVTNAGGAVTSSPAYLNVISAKPVITVPGDSITMYNGSSPVAEVASHAIDGLTSKYLNYGYVGNSNFPPYLGPAGFVVTPSSGSSVVTGVRLFTANDSPERDPADFLVEGSNDGGGTFATIASGTVAMPDDRNPAGLTIDPINQFNREVSFPNSTAYSTYRFSVQNVKNDASANSMQVGEVQLLGGGTSGPPPSVTITYQNLPGGQLQLTWSSGTLQSATTVDGTYTTVVGATSPYTVSTATGTKFYRVKVQ